MAIGSMPARPALLVRIEDSSECFGWGEVWSNFPPRANVHKAHIIEDVVSTPLYKLSFSDPREVSVALREQLSIYFLHVGQSEVFEHILAGIDAALWDLALRHAGVSFASFMDLRDASAASYATSINADDLEELIPRHAELGQSHFKLKVGFAKHGNTHIVEKASHLCPEGARIMVDSNQSWNLAQAQRTLQDIEAYSPLFAEESLPANASFADWEALAASTRIALAGGENIYGIADFLSMVDTGMQYLQPDVAKWGGVSGALDLANALPDGISLWPHFMGSAIGQVAALSIAAAVGKDSCCEVDVNDNALRTELCGDAITIKAGRVDLPTAPGLVVPPKPNMIEAFSQDAR